MACGSPADPVGDRASVPGACNEVAVRRFLFALGASLLFVCSTAALIAGLTFFPLATVTVVSVGCIALIFYVAWDLY
jgi:hypothetical protein